MDTRRLSLRFAWPLPIVSGLFTGIAPDKPATFRSPRNEQSAVYCPQEPFLSIGVTGFEPATSCSQSRRSSQAELHPVAEPFYRRWQSGVKADARREARRIEVRPQTPARYGDTGWGGQTFDHGTIDNRTKGLFAGLGIVTVGRTKL